MKRKHRDMLRWLAIPAVQVTGWYASAYLSVNHWRAALCVAAWMGAVTWILIPWRAIRDWAVEAERE